MTNHKYKTIFIHLAKTGGSSIEAAFGSGWANGKENASIPGVSITERHHTAASSYIKSNGREIWNDYFTFSFVRNPWDWLVSNFFWDLENIRECQKTGRTMKKRRKFILQDCDLDFETFLLKGAEKPEWFVFTRMKDYVEGVDFVGRFENLQSDFDKICDKISKPKEKLPHLKKSHGRKHYSHYYNNETRDIAYNLFKEDIDFFNYKFEST